MVMWVLIGRWGYRRGKRGIRRRKASNLRKQNNETGSLGFSGFFDAYCTTQPLDDGSNDE
jgi:hypothetical protein